MTMISRRVRRLRPRAFPPPLGPRLRATLAVAHAEQPFTPTEVRGAARRVAEVADRLGMSVTLFRGGVDVGGAELDHVWAVVEGRVVDAALPLYSPSFVECLRAFVAGEADADDLERAAHPYSLAWRVVGAFPDAVNYVGGPLWSESRRGAGPATLS